MKIFIPLDESLIKKLKIGDFIEIYGKIFTGRDAVLPKIADLIKKNELKKLDVRFNGGVFFHTGVSKAGIGPTSSNKVEIEENIPCISSTGIKIHLGKGKLTKETVDILNSYNSIYAVTPPISAYFQEKVKEIRLVAFPELGMEAMYEIDVIGIPAIVAIAHGKSIFKEINYEKINK